MSALSNQPLPLRYDHRREWSLMEIMRVLNAIDLLMLHSSAKSIGQYSQYDSPSWTSKMLDRDPSKWGKDKELTQAQREAFEYIYSEREQQCRELGLNATVATIKKIRSCILTPGSTHGDYWKYGDELAGRLVDEVRERVFLSLSLNEAEYYTNFRQKWVEIIRVIPASEGDIEEAGKCFALGRYAASVFHSLQTVELGIIWLGNRINVTDHQAGWNATTKKLEEIIRKKHQDRSEFERQHFAFLEQIHATIEALKNAWRNKVSHAHNKLAVMTSDFSSDVAEEILTASRAFMRRLATEGPVLEATNAKPRSPDE